MRKRNLGNWEADRALCPSRSWILDPGKRGLTKTEILGLQDRLLADSEFDPSFAQQDKRVIGTTTTSATNSAGFNTIFAVTDSARAQVFPMAYFNVRLGNYLQTHWYKRPEDELDITTHFSAGIGVNPNTGTNQPEFFVGMAFGFNKLRECDRPWPDG